VCVSVCVFVCVSWCVKECMFVGVVGFIVQDCPQNGKHVQILVMCWHVYVVDIHVSITRVHVYQYLREILNTHVRTCTKHT